MAGTRAVKAEAKSEDRTFEYEGKTYVIDEDMDEVAMMEAFEDGKTIQAAKILVGPKAWVDFRKTPRKVAQLNDMLTAAFEAMGTTQGES